MIIAAGTTNKAKLDACNSALRKLAARFGDAFKTGWQLKEMAASSGVAAMPLQLEELMTGARNRALVVYDTIRKQNMTPDFALGLEGGCWRLPDGESVFLQSWVYAWDGRKGYWGCSAAITLPAAISRTLYEEQRELAELIDAMSGQQDVRSRQGAFGILTRDLQSRSDSFTSAVINAMAPFLNNDYYAHR